PAGHESVENGDRPVSYLFALASSMLLTRQALLQLGVSEIGMWRLIPGPLLAQGYPPHTDTHQSGSLQRQPQASGSGAIAPCSPLPQPSEALLPTSPSGVRRLPLLWVDRIILDDLTICG